MPARTRVRRLPLLSLVVLALLTILPSPAPAASASAPAGSDISPAEAGGLRLAAAESDKERVPKPKPRYKPSGGEQEKDSDDDSEGFFESCFGSCLESCLSGLFESIFSPHPAEPATALSESLAVGAAETPPAWAVGDRGWLVANTPGDSVALWRSAAERGREDVEAGRLPDGAAVVILESHRMGDAEEFLVRPVDGVHPSGWVPDAQLTSVSPAPPAATDTAPAPPPAPRWKPPFENGRPRFAVRLVPGLGIFYNRDLSVEYDQQSLEQATVDLQVLGFGRRAWLMWGVDAGYRQAWGRPAFDYVTAEAVDVPSDSRWRVVHVDVQFGQRWRDWKGGCLSWSVAPALFHVSERARVRAWTNDGTPVLLGERTERLERWAGGAIVRLGAGWQVAPALELGLQADSHFMAWKGRRERSLAGDFEPRTIGAFDIGIALTYTGR